MNKKYIVLLSSFITCTSWCMTREAYLGIVPKEHCAEVAEVYAAIEKKIQQLDKDKPNSVDMAAKSIDEVLNSNPNNLDKKNFQARNKFYRKLYQYVVQIAIDLDFIHGMAFHKKCALAVPMVLRDGQYRYETWIDTQTGKQDAASQEKYSKALKSLSLKPFLQTKKAIGLIKDKDWVYIKIGDTTEVTSPRPIQYGRSFLVSHTKLVISPRPTPRYIATYLITRESEGEWTQNNADLVAEQQGNNNKKIKLDKESCVDQSA